MKDMVQWSDGAGFESLMCHCYIILSYLTVLSFILLIFIYYYDFLGYLIQAYGFKYHP